jgi:hypothetical protein
MLAVALGPPVMVTIPPGPDVAAVLVGGSVVLVPVSMPGVATAGWPIPSACHG